MGHVDSSLPALTRLSTLAILLLVSAGVAPSGESTGPSTRAQGDGEFRLSGSMARTRTDRASRGGPWEVTGAASNSDAAASDEERELPWHEMEMSTLDGVSQRVTVGAGCLCGDVIFADGFETGDTTAWSTP